MKSQAEKTGLIRSSSSVDELLDSVLSCGVTVEYSTGLKKTRLSGKEAADRIRQAVQDPLSRHSLETLRQGILKAMDMPPARTGSEVRALCLAPADTDLGLFSLLAFSAMGATIVLVPEGKVQAVSETARSHDVTHVVACPLTLSQLMKRLQKKLAREGKLGSLDKALASKGFLGKIFHGSVLRQAATEMTGPSVQVIYTENDGLNPDVIRFFSRLGYDTGVYESSGKAMQDPVETAADVMYVRAAALAGDGKLVVSLDPGLSPRRTAAAVKQISKAVREKAKDVSIVYTSSDISIGGCCMDRGKVKADLDSGNLEVIDPDNLPEQGAMTEDEVRSLVTKSFASVLDRPEEEITYGGDFFRTFNGESLDYFVLLGNLESRFDVELSSRDGSRMSSVKDITRCIMKQMED